MNKMDLTEFRAREQGMIEKNNKMIIVITQIRGNGNVNKEHK